jgi:hypothetical protein
MSGPKVIAYNMNAFKGSLKAFLRLQTQLTQIRNTLQKSVIHDDELNIHYDCGEAYKKISSEIEKVLIALVFDKQGDIDQKTYTAIEKQIAERTKNIKDTIHKSQEVLKDFQNREKDYKSYIEYLSFFENAKSAFEKFKIELSKDTENNFKKENLFAAEDALKKYGSVMVEESKADFNWGFNQPAETFKKVIFDHVVDKENQVRDIRNQMLDKILLSNSGTKISLEIKSKEFKPTEEVQRVSQKIQLLINNCNEKTVVENYVARFDKLKQSESMNDLFFYQELHDSLLEYENSRKNKLRINDYITKLNSTQFENGLDQQKKELIQKSIKLINNAKVSDKETTSLQREIVEFMKQNVQLKEDIELRKKEQLFMKTRIIQNFESLGYNVLDDLEVIDFEKESDFYLQAPGQDNVLNIKFKEDGSFRYVFQIPQKKEALSTEEQKMKLHEMKTTCDDFTNVLNDLKNMGVDIEVKSDKPIEPASMVTISEALMSKFKALDKQVQRKEQIKKLYLE